MVFILFPRLNQINDFGSRDAQCIEKYMSTAESRKNRLDHLKIGNSIIEIVDISSSSIYDSFIVINQYIDL